MVYIKLKLKINIYIYMVLFDQGRKYNRKRGKYGGLASYIMFRIQCLRFFQLESFPLRK